MIAVVGTGHWGRNHVRNFAELGALSAICDTDESALARLKEVYPSLRTYTGLDSLLSDDAIAAIVVASPAVLHYEQARAALAKGRHVLVEKPMALCVREAEELRVLCREQGVVLMVGHVLEYHPAFVELKKLVTSGALGEIVYLYSHRLSLGKIRTEENVWWDLAPHDVSLLVRLLGGPPESVRAAGQAAVTPEIADSVVAWLDFRNGIAAHIFVTWLHPFKEQRLVVVGTERTAVFDDVIEDEKLKLYHARAKQVPGQPLPERGNGEAVRFQTVEPLRAECEHFLRCIEAGAEPLTGPDSAVQVTRVLEAAQRSLDRGGAEVRL